MEVEIAGTETQALLQDEDLENNPGRLLAAERERLKLRERQNKMAIEVQRMRKRLVNLGIAVAEIAHDGECTERKWDGEDRFSGYALPAESPNKRSAFAAHNAAEFRDSCLRNPPSEPPGSAQQGSKRASSFCLQDTIVDENLCKKNGVALSAGESYNLDGATPCMMGTPRTPSSAHNLRNLDGRKIDLWQIKAREDAEGCNRLNIEEIEEEVSMAAKTTSVKQDEKPADKQGSEVEDPSICRLIKIPSKAEVGRVLANRGERNAAERGIISQEHSPRNRTAGPHAKSSESELPRGKEHEIVANHKDTLSSIATTPSTFGRVLKSRENILPFFEEGIHNVEQRLDGRHSNAKPKADSHASIPPSCTFPTCKDSLSTTRFFEASNCERSEMPHEYEESDFQGDSQLIRTQRLFERCKSVNMNEFLGDIPGVEAQDRPPCSSLGPAGEEPCISTPFLPRPVEDYQKSLYDLMEAADRASSLFGEVRSVFRRTTPTPSEAPCTPSTSISLDILSLSRTYQRLLPGTLQTVQRLADEAAACGLPCNRAVITVDNDNLNSFSPGIDLLNNSATGSSMFQSRPGTGASSSLASVDVEGFISRFSETLASQVLALIHKALPCKQS